jgi:PAS domain S-box-containing protein
MIDSDIRELVEGLDAIVWEAETWTWTFRFVSQRAEKLLGYPLSLWFDEPDFWINRIHPEDRERAILRSREAIATGRPYASEYRVMAADGAVLWFRDIVRVVDQPAAGRQCLRGLLIDVTERRRAEELLEQAWRQEREVADRLRALDDLKNSFLTAVSHEMRTPLSTILGISLTLERAGNRLTEAETVDLVARLTANARKLEHLLADLLDLERLHRGMLTAERAETELSSLVRRVVDESGLRLDRPVEVTADRVVADVDAAKLERILENLLLNTARHTPPGTSVWVRIGRDEDGVLLAVEDAGPGVPAELRASVFEPFRRAGGSSRSVPGVGVGLSLVARFAELHGGRAWVEERLGGGASFRVFLPDPRAPSHAVARG